MNRGSINGVNDIRAIISIGFKCAHRPVHPAYPPTRNPIVVKPEVLRIASPVKSESKQWKGRAPTSPEHVIVS
jgi:hypothetical protein